MLGVSMVPGLLLFVSMAFLPFTLLKLLRCSLKLLLVLSGALCSGDEGWSLTVPAEVRGLEGYPVVLPCSFLHPQHWRPSGLQVLWRLGHGRGSALLFRCSSRPPAPGCRPDAGQDGRYRLEGDPRQHDLSLRISGAALQDSGRYYCRVEAQGKEGAVGFEDKMGTRLRVEAPPRILAVSVVGSEQSGYSALCRVQGSPLPDVQWLGPEERLEAALTGPPAPQAQGGPARHLVVSRLQDVRPGLQYTCSASNPLGREQAALYVLPPRPPPGAGRAPPLLVLLLAAALGAKVLLLVGLGLWMGRGGALQGAGCWRR
ncbi:sialic acid-binding Ig-like lectin 15 [Menidia menidia]